MQSLWAQGAVLAALTVACILPLSMSELPRRGLPTTSLNHRKKTAIIILLILIIIVIISVTHMTRIGIILVSTNGAITVTAFTSYHLIPLRLARCVSDRSHRVWESADVARKSASERAGQARIYVTMQAASIYCPKTKPQPTP